VFFVAIGGLITETYVFICCHQKWFVIADLVILTVSLALDLALDATVASLAVVLRIWRMVRIAHGILESALEKQEDEMVRLRLLCLLVCCKPLYSFRSVGILQKMLHRENKELTRKVEELHAQLEEALARKKKSKDNHH
jgi:hypothetical protein